MKIHHYCDSKTNEFINKEICDFIDKFKTLIDNNQYDELYEKLSLDNEIMGISISSFTLLLNDDKINVLSYLHNIPDYFLVNTDVQSYIIPDGYKTIGKEAFKDCRDLVTITIPKTLKEIKASAFENCVNLKVIYYQGTQAEFNQLVICSNNQAFSQEKVQFID